MRILTMNSGSSSIKFALFVGEQQPERRWSGIIERIGQRDAHWKLRSLARGTEEGSLEAADHRQAISGLIAALESHGELDSLSAIGHRVVHGGPRYVTSQRIDATVIEDLRQLIPLAPAHLPGAVACIDALSERCRCPQFACFDTAFHHTLPPVAQRLPIPRKYDAQGVRRYGFHGISYAFLMQELARQAGMEAANQRVVLAHLGAGCSLAAVHQGRCVDTTMAFTPTAGVMMATRTGDLDPGLLVHLMRTENLTADDVDELVNRRSGLLGVSETSSDIRDLVAREDQDVRAAEALELFCWSIRKSIGALAASLNGLDTLVFSAGVGENSAEVRFRVCEGLEFLGVELDQGRNAAHAPVISMDHAPVTVRVIKTDEEVMIVRDVQRLVTGGSPGE